jgi:hypothetical protein
MEPDLFAELEQMVTKYGLRVEEDDCSENQAELYKGDRKLGYLHYNEIEDGWDFQKHSFGWFPLEDVISCAAHECKKLPPMNLSIIVDYDGDAPTITPETWKKLAETLETLLPGKPLFIAINRGGESVHRTWTKNGEAYVARLSSRKKPKAVKKRKKTAKKDKVTA